MWLIQRIKSMVLIQLYVIVFKEGCLEMTKCWISNLPYSICSQTNYKIKRKLNQIFEVPEADLRISRYQFNEWQGSGSMNILYQSTHFPISDQHILRYQIYEFPVFRFKNIVTLNVQISSIQYHKFCSIKSTNFTILDQRISRYYIYNFLAISFTNILDSDL